MSTETSLSELADLAEFTTSAETRGKQRADFWRAYRAGSQHRRFTRGRPVSDLLGVVMSLSARTRRMLAPRAGIELDVFAPGGIRAVRLSVGDPAQD